MPPSFQTANGIVILSPENHQHKTGLTPPEVLILHNLHREYANGSPLGDFFVQKGEAVTIDEPGKAAEEEYYNPSTGKTVPAKPAVAPKSHPRTNAEEVARLKRKYTGNITVGGVATPAFIAVFGSALTVKLPTTFAEIEEAVGITFHEQPAAGDALVTREINERKDSLLKLTRPDVAAISVGMKIKVHAQDTKETIVMRIVEAEQEAEAKAAAEAAQGETKAE